MNKIFSFHIKSGISSLKDNNFQDFIKELLVKRFDTKFIPIKQKRDKGCDGILENRIIIAAYSPEKTSLAQFKRKIKQDYDLYELHWKVKYPGWCVVFNGEFTAEMVRFIDSLKNNAEKWGIDEILNIINSLPWSKKREIASLLVIDEQYFINDILLNVVDDLLKDREVKPKTGTYTQPPYMPDKIKHNYAEKDVASAIQEYRDFIPILAQLKDILKSYNDDEVGALKSKVLGKYDTLAGDFKSKLNNLNVNLAGNNQNDDMYKHYLRAVLIYLFEICLIGDKVKEEI